MLRLCFRFALLTLLASTAAAETYIVPIYGFIQGASGSYQTGLFITNPNATPVTVSVDELFPALSRDCHEVGCAPISATIEPHGFEPIADLINDGNSQLSLGAFTLKSSLPIFLEAWVFTNPPQPQTCNIDYRQQIPLPRSWSPGGVKSFIPAALAFPGAGTNVFVVNPNSFAIRVGYSVGKDVPEQDAILVPPKSTAVQRVTLPSDAPISNTPLNLFSASSFYAVSSNGVIIQPLVTEGGVTP